MKFRRFFLAFSLALALHPALAQPNAKPATATPIRYSRDIPKSVLTLMPRGAKSLFWGTFSPKTGEALMAIHLFNQVQKKANPLTSESLQLGLFQWRKKKWRRINLVQLYVFDRNPTVDGKFFWINPQKTIPLLKLRLFANSEVGPVGTEVAVSFRKGFAWSAIVQYWNWGSWRASDSVGQTLDWSQRDDKGLLQVVCHLATDGQSQPVEQITIWRWDGFQFAPSQP